jgi:hypothetical protein
LSQRKAPLSNEMETIETVIQAVINGERCPIETVRTYRAASDAFEQLKKNRDFLDALESALDRYGKDTRPLAVVYRRAYDYAACGDATLQDLDAQQKAIEAQMQARRAFLKAATAPFFDANGCEVQPPLSKTSRVIETVNNKLKKY